MATQELLNLRGQQYIQQGKATVRKLWEQMCLHDGVSPEEKFFVASEDNPYLPFYSQAMTQLWDAQREYAAGGYVGLSFKAGRVVVG